MLPGCALLLCLRQVHHHASLTVWGRGLPFGDLNAQMAFGWGSIAGL